MVATSLPARMRVSLLGYWQQARPWQRLGYLVGAALIVVGLGHLVAWLVVGGAWAGPITFRKPTTFGISFGLTTITLAWVAGHLRISDRTGWLLLVPLALADASEVVWVSVQRWRGVASHFNNDTTLDSRLFLLMGGGAIAVAATVILVMTVLAFTAMRASPSLALAIRAGLLILLVAQVVGGWMIQHGLGPAEEGVTEGLTTFGAAGVMKVPHAVAIHGIQVLPALAWLLSFAALPEPRRLRLVRIAVVGYAALVVVSVLQTVTGAAPFDVGVVAAVLYLLGVLLLGRRLPGRAAGPSQADAGARLNGRHHVETSSAASTPPTRGARSGCRSQGGHHDRHRTEPGRGADSSAVGRGRPRCGRGTPSGSSLATRRRS